MLRPLLYLGFVAALSSCSEEPQSTAPDAGLDAMATRDMPLGQLIAQNKWVPIDAENDPFDDRPTDVVCERGLGWEVEVLDAEQTLTVETNACNYLGLTQPSLREISSGETLAVQLWHFQLEGDGPAHAAVAIAGNIVWEKTIQIPADSALIYEEFDLPGGAAVGAPVVFHLHNHGLNSWNLVAIRVPD